MIWARRRLGWMGYVPYHERITNMHQATTSPNFVMVARKMDRGSDLEVYVALPDARLLQAFEGFELIPDDLVPMEIDLLLFADRRDSELTRRFSFRNRRVQTGRANSVKDRPRS